MNLRSLILLALVAEPMLAGPVVLYDPTPGTTPGTQGWFYNNPSGAVESIGAGFVELDTTSSNSVKAGYGRIAPFALDIAGGVRLRFDAQLNSETHSSNDRAGFSVIAIGSGLTGIELGFWSDRVFAQNQAPLFTHGEQGFLDTTNLTSYDLFLSGSGYQLWGDGSLILSGALRNYSAAFIPPYIVSNSLFLGDNTSSARADVRLAYVEVETLPEPATILLSSAALLSLGLFRFSRRGKSGA